MTRWDRESNESMYESCDMGSPRNGVIFRVVEWVKINMLRWAGYIERMESEESVKKVYVSESVGPNSRGRPPGRWRDKVKEYTTKVLPEARSVWTGRGGSFSAVATPLDGVPEGSKQDVRAIDR